MTEIQNPKITIALHPFGIWNLGFIWDLVLVICDFRHKTPRHSYLSPAAFMRPGFQIEEKVDVWATSRSIKKTFLLF